MVTFGIRCSFRLAEFGVLFVVALVLSAAAPVAVLSQGARSICPGDCDGDGQVQRGEIERVLATLFAREEPCPPVEGAPRSAEVLKAVSYAALARPLCGAGVRTQWEALPTLAGGERQEVGVAALDDVVYVIGGITSAAVGVSTVEAFDTRTAQWRRVASLPRALHHVAAAADNRFVYAAGGYLGAAFTPVADVFRYDPQVDAWEALAPLPVAVGAAAAAVRGGWLHVVGGGSGAVSSSQHHMLDLQTGVWLRRAALPEAVNHLAAVVWRDTVYTIGGRRDPAGLRNTAALYKYDAGSDRWEALSSMFTARSGHAATVIGDWLAVFGGEVNPAYSPAFVHPHVEVYEFTTDTWRSDVAMPVPRHGFGAAAVGRAVYLPGGAVRAGLGETSWSDRWVIELP
jgi:N-acetylneuraminic acid mutarotase